MTDSETICYEVKDWTTHFENSESKKYKSLTWVPVKNKHDGKGYRRLCQHPKSVQVFCAWSLIIQVASKMPTRGLLADGDGPLTTSDLALKTGFPEPIFDLAFEVLSDPKIGWLKKTRRRPAETPADGGINLVNRTEQNRTEQGGERAREDCFEVPDFERAFAETASAAIPKEFCKFVFDDWTSRSGRDGGGAIVRWLPYVVKRWSREQVEWRSGTHKGRKSAAAERVGPTLDEVRALVKEKYGDDPRSGVWAASFQSQWTARGWRRNGKLIDWKVELSAQCAKWRSGQ